MKKRKMKLEDLKVSSFVTKTNHVRGGNVPVEREPVGVLTIESCLSCVVWCASLNCPSQEFTCGTECTCNDLVCNNTNPICIA